MLSAAVVISALRVNVSKYRWQPNSVDPDQMLPVASDLGLHCLLSVDPDPNAPLGTVDLRLPWHVCPYI